MIDGTAALEFWLRSSTDLVKRIGGECYGASDEICPDLKGKKLSFTRIEARALQGLLLVTSTQFGQTALDGPQGAHSPFATVLLATLEAHPNLHFEQVFNDVARATQAARHSSLLPFCSNEKEWPSRTANAHCTRATHPL